MRGSPPDEESSPLHAVLAVPGTVLLLLGGVLDLWRWVPSRAKVPPELAQRL